MDSKPLEGTARPMAWDALPEQLAASGALTHIELQAQLQAMRDAQLDLEAARDRYASLYDNIPLGCLTLDGRGSILDLNLAGARMLGMERESLLRRPFSVWVHNTDKPAFFSHLRHVIESRRACRVELRLLLPQRGIMHVTLDSVFPGAGIGDEPVVQVVATDVSERKRMEEKLHAVYQNIERQVDARTRQLSDANAALKASQLRERALLNSSPDLAWLKNAEGTYIAVNKAFADFFQQTPEALVGKTDDQLWDQGTVERCRSDDSEIRATHQAARLEEQLTSRAGRSILVETIKTPIIDRGGLIGIAGVARDIAEQKAAQDRIHYLAHYDNLTGLPNRALLLERFDHLIAEAHRNGGRFAVLFIDLDRFKAVNDRYGHRIGDLLLTEAAERIKKCLREVDTVARLGGDEFLVLLSEIRHAGDAARVAEKIRHRLSQSFDLLGNDIRIGSSIGISLYPADAPGREDLIKFADTAMYYAKQRGRDNVQFFDKSAHHIQSTKAEIESRLEKALTSGLFALNFQPVVDIGSGKISGCEVLLRLEYEGADIAPAEFIPVAEATGMILSIGHWVLQAACRQNRAWQDAGLPAIPISVNVSGMQFQDADFTDTVKQVLAETGLESGCLELELTETIIMNNLDSTIRCLQELKALGVKISIDDFGTGYSSLNYLQAFPIDKLKIDQSFVRNLGARGKNSALINAIIKMAKALQIRVTAEGVETLEQLSMLRTENCDYAQGFYYGMPLSATDFSTCLSQTYLPLTLN